VEKEGTIMSDEEIRIERAREILEEYEITLHNEKNTLLRGLTILSKYIDDLDTEVGAEHDQIVCGSFEEIAAKMTEKEIEEMARMGWFEDEEQECWATFV
jgi:hypothetical protein